MSNINKKMMVVIISITLLTITTQSVISQYTQKTKNDSDSDLKDDAYQYNDEKKWMEWWYFNLIDEEKDIQFYFLYSTIIVQKIKIPILMIGIYGQEKSYEIRDFYKAKEFSASKTTPDIKIGKHCIIKAINSDQFILKGTSKDDTINWNLTYDRNFMSHFPKNQTASVKWITYMPSANVTGKIKLNNKIYNITGSGYHDHNFGEPKFNFWVKEGWGWRWISVPNINNKYSLISTLEANSTGWITLLCKDKKIIFKNPEMSYTDFVFKPKISHHRFYMEIYPKNWFVKAEKENYEINFEVNIEKNIPLCLPMNNPLNEQVANFNGYIKNNNQTEYFNTKGFTEYIKFNPKDLFQ